MFALTKEIWKRYLGTDLDIEWRTSGGTRVYQAVRRAGQASDAGLGLPRRRTQIQAEGACRDVR
jgi:hypothetical protein